MSEDKGGVTRTGWLWIATIVVLIALVVYVFADPLGKQPPVPAVQEHVANPTEWTTEEPGGVDVNLPNTPMANVPPESETGEAERAQ